VSKSIAGLQGLAKAVAAKKSASGVQSDTYSNDEFEAVSLSKSNVNVSLPNKIMNAKAKNAN